MTDPASRTLLYLSSSIIVVAMITMAGLGIEEPVSLGRRNGIVAMISLFACGFSTGWGPVPYVITTEVSSLRLRDHTSRIGFTVNVVTK
jgi:MFS transporter, SP family, sugar:H+ symporter